MTRQLKDVLFTVSGHPFRPSLPLLLLLSTIVNGAVVYLVPLVSVALPGPYVQGVQGFTLVALNGLLVYLSTESQQAQQAAPGT